MNTKDFAKLVRLVIKEEYQEAYGLEEEEEESAVDVDYDGGYEEEESAKEEEQEARGDEIYKIVSGAAIGATDKIFSGLRELPQSFVLSTEQLTTLNKTLIDYILDVIDDIRDGSVWSMKIKEALKLRRDDTGQKSWTLSNCHVLKNNSLFQTIQV